ncbi:MAG: DNA repair protein RadC [Clostridia bacterium]|nr:DNA repair protein RadC [Clostridia bacterium]MBR3106084.1 DNA repair protein RadC [Clostridia bacterium]
MEHAGHRERLRKRYAENGLSGFADHEILELLLTFAIPRVNTNPQAHRLINRFGSLTAVLEANQKELEAVEGIGPQASTLLTMMLPLLREYEQKKLLPQVRLTNYADLAAYCRTLYIGVCVEEFYVLSMNADMRLLAAKRIARGTPTEVSTLPRQVLEELLQNHAAAAVISHNHPSGSALPSQEDVDITLAIERLLNGVGIRLYDHVLIAGNQEYSFMRHHMMDRGCNECAEESELDAAAERPQNLLPVQRKRKR